MHACVTCGPWDPARLHISKKWLRVHLPKQSWRTRPAQWVSISLQASQSLSAPMGLPGAPSLWQRPGKALSCAAVSPAHLIYSIGFNFQPHDSISPGGTARESRGCEAQPSPCSSSCRAGRGEGGMEPQRLIPQGTGLCTCPSPLEHTEMTGAAKGCLKML